MSEEKKKETPEEFYDRLKEELNKVEQFPTNFTYKFIILNDSKKIAEVQKAFDGARPQYQMKESKNGKYVSITVVTYVIDAEQVVHYYREVSKVEGVIML